MTGAPACRGFLAPRPPPLPLTIALLAARFFQLVLGAELLQGNDPDRRG